MDYLTTAVVTDTATLVLFDPACMRHRLADTVDWWSIAEDELAEVNLGNAAFFNVPGDGRYALALVDAATLGAPAVSVNLRNLSGRFFLGEGEMMSADGLEPEAVHGNVFFEAAPGAYRVHARLEAQTLLLALEPVAQATGNAFTDLVRLA